jgi:hypothetical protein
MLHILYYIALCGIDSDIGLGPTNKVFLIINATMKVPLIILCKDG